MAMGIAFQTAARVAGSATIGSLRSEKTAAQPDADRYAPAHHPTTDWRPQPGLRPASTAWLSEVQSGGPWVGYGPGIPSPKHPDGFGVKPVEATPQNLEEALTSSKSLVLLSAHHYPLGMKVYPNERSVFRGEEWAYPGEVLKHTPLSKWPTITILNGCDSQRSLPSRMEPPQGKAIIVTTEMEDKIPNVDLQEYLPQILKEHPHLTAHEALQELAKMSGNSVYTENFRIWGDENARF